MSFLSQSVIVWSSDIWALRDACLYKSHPSFPPCFKWWQYVVIFLFVCNPLLRDGLICVHRYLMPLVSCPWSARALFASIYPMLFEVGSSLTQHILLQWVNPNLDFQGRVWFGLVGNSPSFEYKPAWDYLSIDVIPNSCLYRGYNR